MSTILPWRWQPVESARADRAWLKGLITRRAKPETLKQALERQTTSNSLTKPLENVSQLVSSFQEVHRLCLSCQASIFRVPSPA
jgi:hypothetical protein